MTGREIIDACLRFRKPPRVGMTLPDPFPNDVATFGPRPAPEFRRERWTEGGNEYWTDEWGCTWGRVGEISKGEVVRGAIEDWDQLDEYEPPDFGDDRRYEAGRKVVREHPDRYIIAGLPGGWVFATARKIRKMETYLMDLVLEPERIERLHDLIVAENEKVIRKAAELGAHGVMVAEDWGSQTGPLVSPEMFARVFKPRVAHVCGLAHDHGLDCWMHSCGRMTDLMPDLIDAGVDAFQFDQPRLHGIEHLDERFGGRVAFWCPVDIQTTLQTRDPDRIRAEARLMCETLGGHGGGFIAGYYNDNPSLGLDPSVQRIACEAFVEFGGASVAAE